MKRLKYIKFEYDNSANYEFLCYYKPCGLNGSVVSMQRKSLFVSTIS